MDGIDVGHFRIHGRAAEQTRGTEVLRAGPGVPSIGEFFNCFDQARIARHAGPCWMKVSVKMLQQFDLESLQTGHPETEVGAGKLHRIVQQLFPWPCLGNTALGALKYTNDMTPTLGVSYTAAPAHRLVNPTSANIFSPFGGALF
jgi:hypothetical protein